MKNIVLLSDGTGNSAAKRHKTNVWRLYEALDLHRPDQIAFYDDGVGTQQFLPLKLLAGAFGLGLKQNVIRLYEFLCRNYRDGDGIYLFGYSRGAFTVRMLAGLVEKEGIVTGLDDDRELRRAASAAFERYRLASKRGWLTYPVRKWLAGRSERARRAEPCETDQTARVVDPPGIEFIGVWDTVEAYGFPIDELAKFWDFLVLPLRFVEQTVPKMVRRACHALAIDEERQSFHPVLWCEPASSGRDDSNGPDIEPVIEQVWFAGSHGDVGGGHPRHELALVPLDWMISRVEAPEDEDNRGRRKTGQRGLHFRRDIRDDYRRRCDWHGMAHDSRSGLGAYYRYRPRCVEDLGEKAGIQPGEIGVHRGVLERIRERRVPYAPTVLPETYGVVETRAARPGVEDSEWPHGQSDYESAKEAERRTAGMEAARNVVFLRRWLYSAFLVATLFLAASVIGEPEPWLDVSWLNRRWLAAALVVAVLACLKCRAAKATASRAAAAWGAPERNGTGSPPAGKLWLRRFFERPWVRKLTGCALAAVLILGLIFVLASLLSRMAFSVRAQCLPCLPVCEPGQTEEPRGGRTIRFSTSEPCFASGISLSEGQVYRIGATSVGAVDRSEGSRTSGPDGHASPFLLPAALNRRHPSEPWLKLMGRVGPAGRDTVAIGSGPVLYRPKSDGELFLYVNDAVLGVPWGDAWSWFYGNNEGEVEVTVSEVSSGGAGGAEGR